MGRYGAINAEPYKCTQNSINWHHFKQEI